MTLLPKAGMYPYTRECTRYVGWTRRQDGEAVVDGREVWLSLSFEKNPTLEPECITKEEGVVVTRREQRGDGPGTTTTRHYTVDPMLSASGNLFECHEEVLYLQPLIPPKRFDIFPP